MTKQKLILLIREVVSTEFTNDGHGGIESQTSSDTMSFYHSDSGPLHQGNQPGEVSPHLFFGGDGGAEEQSSEQSDSASESGAKEQAENGLEESEE